MDTAIVILNWNGIEDTRQCLDSLQYSSDREFHIFLADNGSDADFEPLSDYCKDMQQVTLLSFDTNLGFCKAVNRIVEDYIDLERYDNVVLLNNDTIVSERWLGALKSAVSNDRADIVASLMVRHDDNTRLDNAGHLFLNTGEILPRGADQLASDFSRSATVEGACGGACLITSRVIRKIGVFDPFFSTGYEDAEFGLRALLAGFRIRFAPDAFIQHKISRSVDKIRDKEYAVQLQVNIYYSYFKLMPAGVLIVNMPFLAIRLLGVALVSVFTLRLRLLSVQVSAVMRTIALRNTVLCARRIYHGSEHLRLGTGEILSRQTFFLGSYLSYFRKYIFSGKKTVFER